jgi:F0F1-type ATP synthase assembly protein I
MKEKKQPEFDAGYGLAVGLMLGVAIGVCLDNIGVWMPIGLLFGLAIDYSLKRKR